MRAKLVASVKQVYRASGRAFCELNLLLASFHFATLIAIYGKIRQTMLPCMVTCDICHMVETLCDISLFYDCMHFVFHNLIY